MKNKYLIIVPIATIQFFSIKVWTECKIFLDYYHFSFYDLELQLIYAINHDYESPILVARFFHNKVVQFAIDIYKRYTHFFDWQLLITLLSFLGVFGVILAIWYFLDSKKKDKKIGMLIIAALLIPFFEVLINPKLLFNFKLLTIAVPFNLLSLFGHYQFLRTQKIKRIVIIYLVLTILSLAWIFLIPEQVFKYCVKT